MNRKKCSNCEKYFDISNFNWKLKKANKRSSKCKTCTNEYCRKHYQDNKELYKERSKFHTRRYAKEGRKLIYEFKLSNPCASCSESNPVVLEFHHIDPKKKRNDVSNMATHGYSIESIEKEIEKCIILCANCHRRKTAKQQNWHSHKQNERNK